VCDGLLRVVGLITIGLWLDLGFVTGSIARSATRRYLSYSEADFEVFRPQGRHVAPMGYNLA